MNRYFNLTILLILAPAFLWAQEYKFKPLKHKKIKGAPVLSEPKFIQDRNNQNIQIGKLGHSYPAVWDYDNDGKLDLVVGEFMLGTKSNLRAYKNIGTTEKPVYDPTFEYISDSKGTPLHIKGL